MSHKQHNYEQESAQYYDKIAVKFDRTFDGFLSSFFKRFIVKNLTLDKNAAVLDIGCANGTLLSMLNAQQTIAGTGLDISSEMVKRARQLHPEFSFECGTATQLDFAAQSFDALICSASFHHFPEPAQFLQAAQRVVRPDGRLIIAEIHIPVVTRLYNWRLRRFSSEGDVKVYRPAELAALFSANGWRIKKRKIFLQIQYYELIKSPDVL